jgi:hypothetical protein
MESIYSALVAPLNPQSICVINIITGVIASLSYRPRRGQCRVRTTRLAARRASRLRPSAGFPSRRRWLPLARVSRIYCDGT